MMRIDCDRFRGVVLAVFSLLVLGGCDNSLDPIQEDVGLFSVYGYISPTNDHQLIRVRDLNDPLVRDSTRTLTATVTLENLETGRTETLTDSIVTFQGIFTHNFQPRQDIQHGVTYRLSVQRTDGRSVQTTATTPEVTTVDLKPAGPVECVEQVEIFFRNVTDQRLVRVSVGFAWRNHLTWVDLDVPTIGDTGTPYNAFNPATILEGVFPERFQDTLGQDPANFCGALDDDKFRIAYTHFGPDWPTDRVLTDPLESNVENGLGIFGGLRRDTLIKTVTPGN